VANRDKNVGACMSVNVKSTVILRHFCSKWGLLFVSLLFVIVLFSSGFVCVFSGGVSFFALGVSNKVVSNETDLKNAVNSVSGTITIALNNDITLTETLVIPANKDITLTSNIKSKFYKLIGPKYVSTITVEKGGVLKLEGVIVTHKSGEGGQGVIVKTGGKFIMYSGEVSGNNAFDRGGGIHNLGSFVMYGGVVSNNVANYTGDGVLGVASYSTNGGGVWNKGSFEMSGGLISNNFATYSGGGVENIGVFTMTGGQISDNVASWPGGGVLNTGVFTMSGGMITDNTVTYSYGGGVYNDGGVFNLSGDSLISNNKAIGGGGVYNTGTFNRRGGVVSDNIVSVYSDIFSDDGDITNGYGGIIANDDGIANDDDILVVVLIVSIVVIVSIVAGGLFFYFKKNPKKQMTNKQIL